MTGQIVARILLVVTLIVAAHIIKPFSVKNVTEHLLYSTRSFAFILPESARVEFDHANQLAINFSSRLLDVRQVDEGRRSGFVPEAYLVVAVHPQLAQPEDTAVKLNKAVIRSQVRRAVVAEPDQGEELKELISSDMVNDEVEAADEVAVAENTDSDSTPVAAPVALPALHVLSNAEPVLVTATPSKIRAFKFSPIVSGLPGSIEIKLQMKKSECEQHETRRIKLITMNDEESGQNPDQECDEVGTSVAEVEVADSQDEPSEVMEHMDMFLPAIPLKPENCLLEP